MRKNRYYATRKVEVDGIIFDSKPEGQRYLVLKEAEKRGLISDLKIKEVFVLIPRQTEAVEVKLKTKTKIVQAFREHPLTYESDFTYIQDGRKVINDVKGGWLTEDYRIKRKVARWVGFPITEIFDPVAGFEDVAASIGIYPMPPKKKPKNNKQ